MKRGALCAGVAAAMLGGCTVDLNTRAVCIQERPQAWIGQVYTDAAADRIRDLSRASKVRVLRPGDITTMEFNRKRVTVSVDEAGRISRIACG